MTEIKNKRNRTWFAPERQKGLPASGERQTDRERCLSAVESMLLGFEGIEQWVKLSY